MRSMVLLMKKQPSSGHEFMNESTISAPSEEGDAVPMLLRLPRELRNQIYNYVFSLADDRGDRALRIERRHLRYFKPTAATILLVLHHEDLLLNQQIAAEALEILLKNHTLFLSCGPFVLKTLLSRIEEEERYGKRWLKWLKRVEFDWVTFPNLRIYPPNRENGKDEWWWENDGVEVDVDYVPDAQYNANYDEYDYEGSGYDDNFYEPEDTALYPTFHNPDTYIGNNNNNTNFVQPPDPADPFGFSTHYPFANPLSAPVVDAMDNGHTLSDNEIEIQTKLEMLVDMEVKPLFTYLASPSFALSSITLPLYFISKQTYHQRNTIRPGWALPLKLRYWVQVAVQALLFLHSPTRTSSYSGLEEVRIKYMPWDIWASMDPSDDLERMEDMGVWFDDRDDDGEAREGEGEALKAVYQGLRAHGVEINQGSFSAKVSLVKWKGDLDKWRVGDELEIVFTRAE